MEIPTANKPALFLDDGPLRVSRGYELIDPKKEAFVFVGCHDGPLLQFRGPRGDPLLMEIEFVPRVIEALQAAMVPPVAAPGAHDEEIKALGLLPIGR